MRLVTDGWERDGVAVARSGQARRRGLNPRPAGRAMLIPGGSVHGFGMHEPVAVVGIDPDGRVLAAATLRPRRVVRFRGAAWVLELPAGESVPPVGSRLGIVANLG